MTAKRTKKPPSRFIFGDKYAALKPWKFTAREQADGTWRVKVSARNTGDILAATGIASRRTVTLEYTAGREPWSVRQAWQDARRARRAQEIEQWHARESEE